jgi:hypothetical protein
MSESIIVAILGFFGTIVGSGIGAYYSASLTAYRLEQLEKKVELHNNVVERVYELEKREALLEQHVEDLHSEG